MDFRLTFPVPVLTPPVRYGDKLLLMGSCFAEETGHLLQRYKFDAVMNPHGILYNPVSLVTALNSYLEEKKYTKADLFLHNGLWHSWDHHGRFSEVSPEKCLEKISRAQEEGIRRLAEADWLMLTPGTAHVHVWKEEQRIVGNCHKVPANRFTRRLLRPDEIITALDNFMHKLFFRNRKVRILFTVSPVRYIRDGVVESQLSKAALLWSVHHLVNKFDRLHYFPSYELVIDDLRDYRFYKEDLVHPNETAVRYVWEQFTKACIAPESKEILQQVEDILRAAAHRPLHPGSSAYEQFKSHYLQKIEALKTACPFLDLKEEEAAFTGR